MMNHIKPYSLFESENLAGLVALAKASDDYIAFIKKTNSNNYNDSIRYDILYRGMADDNVLTDKSFMTDWWEHARDYGDTIDGVVLKGNDVLRMTGAEFEKLRDKLGSVTKKELQGIYSYYFKHDKLFDVMEGEYAEGKDVIRFVFDFLRSDVPYTKIQNDKVKNDLMIPVMLHYATKLRGKNVISFVGGDYSDYGGADEFVVDDVSRYTKLSDIWKGAKKIKR